MLATLDHFLRRRGGRGSWFTKPEAYVCVCQSVLSLLALLVTVACHWSRISSFPCRAPPRVCVVRGSSCGISCSFTINIKLVPFPRFTSSLPYLSGCLPIHYVRYTERHCSSPQYPSDCLLFSLPFFPLFLLLFFRLLRADKGLFHGFSFLHVCLFILHCSL